MFMKTWRRPTEIKHPEVWSHFERKKKDGEILKFRIQTMTVDYEMDVMDMFFEYFAPEETLHATTGCYKCPVHKELLKSLIDKVLYKQECTLVCVEDKDIEKPRLVGFNMCGVCSEEEKMDLDEMMKNEATAKLMTIVVEAQKQMVKIEEKYKIQKYLGSLALCVHPDYRGLNVSKEILLARICLCKEIGLKITSAYFTGIASQTVALKAGYFEESSILYEDLSKCTGIPINTKTLYMKQLSYKVQ